MTYYFLTVLPLVAFLAVAVTGQKTQELIIDGYGDAGPRDGELTFPDTETKDREYFANLQFSRDEIPKEVPVEDQVLKEYSVQSRSGAIELDAEVQIEGDKTLLPSLDETSKTAVSAGNLYVYYYQQWLTYRKCCPRSQSYQCSWNNVRLPCFKHYRSGRWGVCCPLWPQVYIAQCNCGQCSRLCENCVQTGTCVNNYSYKWFIAVCYNLGFWNRFLVFNRYLPTSCSCNAAPCV